MSVFLTLDLSRVNLAPWPPGTKTAKPWRIEAWVHAPARWTPSSSSAQPRGSTRARTRWPCRSRTWRTAPTSASRSWVSRGFITRTGNATVEERKSLQRRDRGLLIPNFPKSSKWHVNPDRQLIPRLFTGQRDYAIGLFVCRPGLGSYLTLEKVELMRG